MTAQERVHHSRHQKSQKVRHFPSMHPEDEHELNHNPEPRIHEISKQLESPTLSRRDLETSHSNIVANSRWCDETKPGTKRLQASHQVPRPTTQSIIKPNPSIDDTKRSSVPNHCSTCHLSVTQPTIHRYANNPCSPPHVAPLSPSHNTHNSSISSPQ
jgi:hypothetical protein